MKRIDRILAILLLAGLVALDGGGLPARADTAVPAVNPLAGDEAAIRKGRSSYRNFCSPCHGGKADGAGERMSGTSANLQVFKKGFRNYVETVKNGRDVPNRTQKMPAWGKVLSDDEIYQIGAYLETLAKKGANWGEPASQ
jgi:mono/diheme cytochrome c family protein